MAQLGDLIVSGKARFLNEINGQIDWSNVLSKPTIPTVTDTYSATGTAATSGKAVAAALGTLDGSITGTAGASKTLTAFSQTDGKVSATFANISITKSQVSDFPTSMTPTSHTHGNIQNGGTLQTTDVTIANGDKLVVTDSSDSAKIARTSISFDGSTTTQCLTKKGEWATFVDLSSTQALTNKTYNGYTLGAACAKSVDTSPTSSSSNLVTSGGTYSHIVESMNNSPQKAYTDSWAHNYKGETCIFYGGGYGGDGITDYIDDVAQKTLTITSSDIVFGATTGQGTATADTWDGTNTSLKTTISAIKSTADNALPSTATAADSTKWNGMTDDHGTNNTTDSWVPVYSDGKVQHRVISTDLNNRAVTNLTAITYIPYSSTNLVTVNAIAFWNGAYNSSGTSNLAYCNKGAFGNVVTKNLASGTGAATTYYDRVCYISGSPGITELGQYIDFHIPNSNVDYSTRIYANSSGGLSCSGAFSPGSSRKIKKNIEPISQEEADKILLLEPVKFDYKLSEKNDQADTGFIAEDVYEILPKLTVPEEGDESEHKTWNPMGLKYEEIIPYLVKVVQRQQKEIDELKKLIV